MNILMFLAVLSGNVPAEAPRDNCIIAVRAAVAPVRQSIDKIMTNLTKGLK